MNTSQTWVSGASTWISVKSQPNIEEVVDTTAARNDTERVAISIVSNGLLFSEGIFSLLSTRLPIDPIGAYLASSAIDAPYPSQAGHIVLLDSNMGRPLLQSWARAWRSRTPPVHVILIETANDVDLIVDCIEAGVGGYTLQGESIEGIVRTIGEVQKGIVTYSSEVTACLCARLTSSRQLVNDLALNLVPLTPRELEVLSYVAQNRSNQEIAMQLVIEVRTVKHHVHNILEKLHLKNRHEAALHAARQGWLMIR